MLLARDHFRMHDGRTALRGRGEGGGGGGGGGGAAAVGGEMGRPSTTRHTRRNSSRAAAFVRPSANIHSRFSSLGRSIHDSTTSIQNLDGCRGMDEDDDDDNGVGGETNLSRRQESRL